MVCTLYVRNKDMTSVKGTMKKAKHEFSLDATYAYVSFTGGSVWFPPDTKHAFRVKEIFTQNTILQVIYWYPTGEL